MASPTGDCPSGTSKLPAWITLSVTLQRPNAPAPDPSWAVPVHFALYAPGDPDEICEEWDLTLDESGVWSGTLQLFTGLYDVRVKNMHTLRNVRHDVEITSTTGIDVGELHEGDANGDNRVRITDFGILRNAYFTNEGDPGFDPRADFDENDEIRIRDFSLLRLNYFQDGDIVVGSSVDTVQRTLESVDLWVEPPTTTVDLSDQGTVTVTAQAGGKRVVGAEFDLRFAPQFLRAIDARPAEQGVQIEPAGPLSEILFNQVDSLDGTGRIRYAAGTFGAPFTGTIPLGIVHFETLMPAETTEFRFASADVTDPDGSSVVGDLRDGTIVIRGTRCYLPLVVRSR